MWALLKLLTSTYFQAVKTGKQTWPKVTTCAMRFYKTYSAWVVGTLATQTHTFIGSKKTSKITYIKFQPIQGCMNRQPAKGMPHQQF